MFADCKTELEKNQYKRSGRLKEEFDAVNKKDYPEYYLAQRIGSYTEVFQKTCELVDIPVVTGRFIYFIDPQFLFDTTRGYRFENLTPDYSIILEHGIEELKYSLDDVDDTFCGDYNSILDSMIILSKRIVESTNDERIKTYFTQMQNTAAVGFEEAMQRILFVNQLLWQMGHRLVGLGHLDMLLYPYYQKEKDAGKLTIESAKTLMKDFLFTLHEYYWLKSNVLLGDTGQIIVLGKSDSDGEYVYNELTYLWIEVIKEVQLPDPKILLRVNSKMPHNLMELALDCMQTGIGSPILANDEVIIPALLQYNVPDKDAVEYGVSACWEPLIPGKSISMNNVAHLKYPQVFINMLENNENPSSFDEMMELFYKELQIELEKLQSAISLFRLQYNPLLSVFMNDCRAKKKDVSCGGAGYSNYGITTVGLANAVNSLLNIKKFVFDNSHMTFEEIKSVLAEDYEKHEQLRLNLKSLEQVYGKDDEFVLKLTNDITKKTTEYTKGFRNYLGGTLKFGVSAPTYIDAAKDFPATFDGRKKGDPFAVHISSDRGNGYTEIVNFAAGLDYAENRFNGNVVDFMVTPHFINQNFDKFTDFLMTSIEVGFFELQMNVVGSDVLIAAKKEPDKYTNLIVRVWGFSAYFNELPENYQNVLIRRTLENEGKNYCY